MLLLLSIALLQSPDTSLRSRVERALAAAPIERFDSATGKTIVQQVLPLDLDSDGRPEAAAVLRPAFRQTPTIIFFRQVGADSLVRLPEGLAPGRLIPVDDSQRDSHVIRVGIDFTPETHGAPYDTLAMVRAANRNGLNAVAYRTFFHADKRQGAPFFVLLTDHSLPPDDSLTCGQFRFSEVIEARFGHLTGGGATNYLVVLTSGEVTIYQFSGITPDGGIVKHSTRRTPTSDPTGLTTSSEGTIALSSGGHAIPIQAPPDQ